MLQVPSVMFVLQRPMLQVTVFLQRLMLQIWNTLQPLLLNGSFLVSAQDAKPNCLIRILSYGAGSNAVNAGPCLGIVEGRYEGAPLRYGTKPLRLRTLGLYYGTKLGMIVICLSHLCVADCTTEYSTRILVGADRSVSDSVCGELPTWKFEVVYFKD